MLRDALGIPAEPWRDTVARAAGHEVLRLWTGEIWCRLFLEGRSRSTVEQELWRDGAEVDVVSRQPARRAA